RKLMVPAVVFSESLASSAPLKKRIEHFVTADLLRKVAQAHARGRRLFVGTTNLDTRRLTIWDMGAIASRGTPEALDLYRAVLLASSSVPGFLPPVHLDVRVDGHHSQEMHVDGVITSS